MVLLICVILVLSLLRWWFNVLSWLMILELDVERLLYLLFRYCRLWDMVLLFEVLLMLLLDVVVVLVLKVMVELIWIFFFSCVIFFERVLILFFKFWFCCFSEVIDFFGIILVKINNKKIDRSGSLKWNVYFGFWLLILLVFFNCIVGNFMLMVRMKLLCMIWLLY